MWMFSHSHTLKTQKYAHARDWMKYTHIHTHVSADVCMYCSLHSHTGGMWKHDDGNKTLEESSVFVKCEGHNGQISICLFLIFEFFLTLVHSHSFSYSVACNDICFLRLNSTYKEKNVDWKERQTELVTVNIALWNKLNSGYSMKLSFSIFYSIKVVCPCLFLSFFIYVCFIFHSLIFLSFYQNWGFS